MHNMSCITVMLTIVLCLSALCTAYDLYVVGPWNYPAPQYFKWSPNGHTLAFFRGCTLCVSDTLGHVTQIKNLTLLPRKFEWIDDTSLAVRQEENVPSEKLRQGTYKHHCISEIRLSGEEIVLLQDSTTGFDESSLARLDRAVNGTVYISFRKDRREQRAVVPAYDGPMGTGRELEDFILGINDRGLYRIGLQAGDSVLLLVNNRGYTSHKLYQRPIMNRERNLVLLGRGALVIVNLTDSSEVLLDPFLGVPPAGLPYCGFTSLSFCPSADVLFFEKTCDDGKDRVISNICTFDYTTREFVSFDSFTGSDFEISPVPSTDCRHIAFLSGSKGICIVRLGGNNEGRK